ncbi:MAG: DUF6242 domain-containing protein [Tannerella sp.]|jgi:hypothetical protein|nr:DUF6242 domain-containing protein [Tannerella sp.]
MKKNRLHIWILGGVAFLLSSCLSDNYGVDEWDLSNCQITSFKLKNDSIPELENVKFTIDQVNGQIFNKDSMPFGTVIDRKVLCDITYELNPSGVEVYQEALKDSTFGWNGTDSLDFSDFVRFIIYSYDGKASKTYMVRLNVHQQNPDSMAWTLYSERLAGSGVQEQKVIVFGADYWMYVKDANGYSVYTSPRTDVPEWTGMSAESLADKIFHLSQITIHEGRLYLPASDGSLYHSSDGSHWEVWSGAPQVVTLLGALEASVQTKRPAALAAVVREGDDRYFAALTGTEWTKGAAVPERFPTSGFGVVSYEQMYYPHLTIVAGKDREGRLSNAAWSTMDGLAWTCLTGAETSYFEPREGVMLTQYDDKLCLIGGIDASDKALKDIYWSIDKGVSWTPSDSLKILPEDCRARGYASALTDDNRFLLLFGGKESNNANVLEEIWRGRINRLGFVEE